MKSHATEVERLRAEWGRFSEEAASVTVPVLARLLGVAANYIRAIREFRPGPLCGDPLGAGFAAPLTFGRTPSEISRGEALRSVRMIAPGRAAAPGITAEQNLDELLKLFERHRVLGHFTTDGETRGLSEILIPRAEKELTAARSTAERLAKTLGEEAEETRKAFQ